MGTRKRILYKNSIFDGKDYDRDWETKNEKDNYGDVLIRESFLKKVLKEKKLTGKEKFDIKKEIKNLHSEVYNRENPKNDLNDVPQVFKGYTKEYKEYKKNFKF